MLSYHWHKAMHLKVCLWNRTLSTFITFLGLSRGFFPKTVVLHASSFQGYNGLAGTWTSSHFALLSFGKLITLVITGIQAYHTLSVCVVNQNTPHDYCLFKATPTIMIDASYENVKAVVISLNTLH